WFIPVVVEALQPCRNIVAGLRIREGGILISDRIRRRHENGCKTSRPKASRVARGSTLERQPAVRLPVAGITYHVTGEQSCRSRRAGPSFHSCRRLRVQKR